MSKSPKRLKSRSRNHRALQKTGAESILSGEEKQLWSYVTRDASPLKAKATDRVVHGGGASGGDEDFAGLLGCPPRHIRDTTAKAGPAGCKPEAGTVANPFAEFGTASIGRSKGGPASMDRRSIKKIARGVIEIDARIDLHGMRQREAHGALRRFLFNAHAKGHRIVLVITGKGKSFRNHNNQIGDDDGDLGFRNSEEPGVLRRNVPHWLGEGDLNAIVAAFTTAHIRHGGDGALYIHLRKRKTLKPR